MIPYYEDDLVTLYHGDFRDVSEWAEADVLVTDPPYGMMFQSNFRSVRMERIEGDEDTTARDEAVSRWGNDRPALVFGRWSIPAPEGERQRLIWHKDAAGTGMGDLRIPWGTAHEDIHLLGNGWDVSAVAAKRSRSVITTRSMRGGVSGPASETGHPTPKPVPLMEYLIERCPPGTVADPFAGAGATLIAARNLGRRAIGVEIEEKYCEVAARRLGQQAFDFTGLEGPE